MNCKICSKKLLTNKYNYVYCSNCGIYKKKEFIKYGKGSFDWGDSSEVVKYYISGNKWRIKVFEDRLNLINLLKPNGNSLLDIGSATGLFGSLAQKFGYDVSLVEPFKPFRDYSKKNNKNITHFNSITSVKNKYDIITIFDAIGYSLDIEKDIYYLTDLLNNNGILFISASYVDNLFDDKQQFSFHYFFEKKFWTYLVPKKTNLEIVKIWSENKNLNTKVQGTKEWWSDYLQLNDEIKMNYIIYTKNKFKL